MTIFGWLLSSLFVALLLFVFRPKGGYIDYIKSCPLWHNDSSTGS